MTRDEVTELHYITHVDNVASILRHGILSHNRARKLDHRSVALAVVQERRQKQVPNARLLHDYVCLYFNARNPMMFRIVRGDMAEPSALVVLRVAPAVLDLPNVVITDADASSEYVAFHPSPDGLAVLDCALVLARVWTSDDPFEYYRRKSAICAEVLVPDAVTSRWISGAYVSGNVTSERLRPVAGEFAALDITVNPDIFFL
jgi:hypothetical protein